MSALELQPPVQRHDIQKKTTSVMVTVKCVRGSVLSVRHRSEARKESRIKPFEILPKAKRAGKSRRYFHF